MRRTARITGLALALALTLGPWVRLAAEEEAPDRTPRIEIQIGGKDGEKPATWSSSVRVVVLMTLLALAPAMLVMTTSFTRTIIVLGFVRHALSTQQMPPNIVLMGLSLFLTLFTMSPVWSKVKTEAYQPFSEGKITQDEAIEKAVKPMREFMGSHTRKKDLALFLELSNAAPPQTFDDVPTITLIPAFIISELRTAFQMGFLIFLPFVVIDLVVASILMSLGMVMLPPAMISLPLKLLLFVMADGWHLVVKALVVSFGAG